MIYGARKARRSDRPHVRQVGMDKEPVSV